MKRGIRIVVLLVSATFLVSSLSQEMCAQSARTEHKFGLHLGLLGDPFPTLLGINGDYNITDWGRLTAGYGSVSVDVAGGTISATTFGGGIRAMVPNWNITPVLGLSVASVSVSYSSPLITGDVKGFAASTTHLYVTFGLDYQAGIGFNVGLGFNYSLKSGVGGLPYVNLGWYF